MDESAQPTLRNQVIAQAGRVAIARFAWVGWALMLVHLIAGLSIYQLTHQSTDAAIVQWAGPVARQHGVLFLFVVLVQVVALRLRKSLDGNPHHVIYLETVVCIAYLLSGAWFSVMDVRYQIGFGLSTYCMVAITIGVIPVMQLWRAVGLQFIGLVYLLVTLQLPGVATPLVPSFYVVALTAPLLGAVVAYANWTYLWQNVSLREELNRSYQTLVVKQKEVEQLATIDSLTGLFNRREFLQQFNAQAARSGRVPATLSGIMVDIDHFKSINDRFGHPAGDAVLRTVAATLYTGVRNTDMVGRWGGEEFVILMPNTEREGAVQLAEKLRLAIKERTTVVAGKTLSVCASFGVTTLAIGSDMTIDAFYTATDYALYQAKRLGRDQVQWASAEQARAATHIAAASNVVVVQ